MFRAAFAQLSLNAAARVVRTQRFSLKHHIIRTFPIFSARAKESIPPNAKLLRTSIRPWRSEGRVPQHISVLQGAWRALEFYVWSSSSSFDTFTNPCSGKVSPMTFYVSNSVHIGASGCIRLLCLSRLHCIALRYTTLHSEHSRRISSYISEYMRSCSWFWWFVDRQRVCVCTPFSPSGYIACVRLLCCCCVTEICLVEYHVVKLSYREVVWIEVVWIECS